ncbi:MAG: protein TolQ [Pseudomonadota bacterium]
MNTDFSFWHLVLSAGPVVKLVMILLVLLSVISWIVIYSKSRQLSRAIKEATAFENEFWSGADANQMYQHLRSSDHILSGMEHVFERGFSEFARLVKQTNDSETVVDGSYRAMKIALSRETDTVEQHISFLATVGSTAPYIGLFGTVWGIMNSFTALADVQQATLAMVAPGIAEALIATAIGLFAAIPAVIAYNRLSNKADRLLNRYDNFMEEFAAVLQRQVLRRNQAAR